MTGKHDWPVPAGSPPAAVTVATICFHTWLRLQRHNTIMQHKPADTFGLQRSRWEEHETLRQTHTGCSLTIPLLTLSCSLSALLCEFVRRCEASVQNNTTGFQDCGPTRSLMPMWAISKHATSGFHHPHRSIHARWWWDEYQRIQAKEYRGVFEKGGEGDYNQGRV